ncbi:DUF5667 domain-containing protein [Nocardioides sp. DS6]|uniref:DUF5667 domain-containing protein n=1 Tax=Nocardioides eburneus TaxID=3231482 RepID=A0ABV3STG7_9ACTN
MSPAFPARRRADEFHRLVEAEASSGATATPHDELSELAALATGLRELPAVAPRADFSVALRERLMAAAETEFASPTSDAVAAKLTVQSLSRSSSAGRRQRRLTVGIAAFAIIGGTAGAAVASQGALPGDTLYPVKRAIENVRTGFVISDHSKGSTLLSDADTRLDEVHKLTDVDHTADSAAVRTALESFSSQATKASDLLLDDYQHHQNPKSLDDLRSFASNGITRLSDLQSAVPESAQGAIGEAAQTLLLIDQAAQALCPSCGPGITQLPQNLLRTVSTTLDSTTSGLTGDLGLTGSSPSGDGGLLPGPALPSVKPGELPPGSTKSGSGTGTKSSSGQDSQGGSTSGDTTSGSGTSSGTGSSDSTGSSSGQAGEPSSSPTTGLGDTVGDVVGGVTGTVGGLLSGVGGLLGASPTP